MSLIPTPVLQSEIQQLLLDYTKKLWSGDGIDDNNMYSDPEIRNVRTATFCAEVFSKAMEKYIESIIFTVPTGLPTAGSPTNHVSVSPWIVTKT